MSEAPSPSPAQHALNLIAGAWVAQAISTAARLGVFDALAAEPRTADALGRALGCHADALDRLLSVLTGEAVLTRGAQGVYALTPTGQALAGPGLGDLAAWTGDTTEWAAWAQLAHSVKTGAPAFDRAHGAGLFEHLARSASDARSYDRAVDAFTAATATALARAVDFGKVTHLVDVGGGRGTVLREVLRRWPDLRGTLFERPDVAQAAGAQLAAEFSPRCHAVGGDFHNEVPEGADAYLIKHVLHNWGDAAATALLRRCADAARRGGPAGTVLVVDGIMMPPGPYRDPNRLLDLEMLVLTRGGRERRKPAWRRLFSDAGLRLRRTQALTPGVYLMVGQPRPA